MSNRAKAILLFIIDSLILFIALLVVVFASKLGTPSTAFIIDHIKLFTSILPIWTLMYFVEGIYTLKTHNPATLPISLLRGSVIAMIVSAIVIYLLPVEIGEITAITNLVLMGFMALPLLFWSRRTFFTYFSNETRLRNTFIVGSQETLDLVEYEIGEKPYLGYRIIALCTPDIAYNPPDNAEFIVLERHMPREHNLYKQVFGMLGSGVEIMDLAKFAEQISGKIPLKAIDESWFIEYCGHQVSRSYDIFKSIIDKTVAITILLIIILPFTFFLLPVLLVIHGRPIFFKQVRTGLNNKPFTILKLRTMVVDAEKNGAQWAKPGDARITPLGKFLRKTRIDELPQLINIIRGDMSLVGPRPERPEIIEKQLAPNIPYYALRHLVKPGVTGWAQVTFRYGFSEEDSKEKLQYDLFYVKNRSIWLDMLVVIKTIKTVVTGAGQ